MNGERENKMENALCDSLRLELLVLRVKSRLSQENLAIKKGFSKQVYSAIETGKRKMPWTLFLALVAYFRENENTIQMVESIDALIDGI